MLDPDKEQLIKRKQKDSNFKPPIKRILLVTLPKSGSHLIKNIFNELRFNPIWFNKNYNFTDFELLKENEIIITHFLPDHNILEQIERKNIYTIFYKHLV